MPLLILSAAAFVTVTVELVPAGLLIQIGTGLVVPPARAGLLVTAWAITVAGLTLPLVRLLRGVDPRRLVVGALAVLAVSTVGTAVSTSFAVAVLTRVIAAAAHGVFWSLLPAIAASMVPAPLIGRAVAVALAGPAVAGVLGIPAAAALGDWVGWRATFAALSAGLVLTAVIVGATTPTVQTPTATQRQRGSTGMTDVAVLAGATGLVLTGHFMLYTYISPVLAEIGGYGGRGRAVLLLVFGAAGVVGVLLAGRLSDRWPYAALPATASGFVLATASLGVVGHGAAAAAGSVAVWGLLIGLLPPVFQTRLLRSVEPNQRSTAGAVAVTVLSLGIAAGALAGGQVLDNLGVDALPLTAAVLTSTAAAILTLNALRQRQTPT